MPTKKELKRRLERKEMLLQGAREQCERIRGWWLAAEQKLAGQPSFLGIWHEHAGPGMGVPPGTLAGPSSHERKKITPDDSDLVGLVECGGNEALSVDEQVTKMLGLVMEYDEYHEDWLASLLCTISAMEGWGKTKRQATSLAFADFARWQYPGTGTTPHDKALFMKTCEMLGFSVWQPEKCGEWHACFEKSSLNIEKCFGDTEGEAVEEAFLRWGRALIEARQEVEHEEVRKRADELIEKSETAPQEETAALSVDEQVAEMLGLKVEWRDETKEAVAWLYGTWRTFLERGASEPIALEQLFLEFARQKEDVAAHDKALFEKASEMLGFGMTFDPATDEWEAFFTKSSLCVDACFRISKKEAVEEAFARWGRALGWRRQEMQHEAVRKRADELIEKYESRF